MKQMRIKRTVCLFLAIAVLAASLVVSAKRAEGAEPRVYIADEVQGRADHRSMEMGTKRDNFYVEFSDKSIKEGDYQLDWVSSNKALVTVGYSSAIMRNVVEAKDEGTAVITAKVTLRDGRVLTDSCIISVYTKRNKTLGILSEQATFYRAASTQSVIRKTESGGQEFTIVASCGSYYRVQLPENYKFDDSLKHQYAYVLKSKVDVPVTGVKLSEKEIQLGISGRRKLGKTIYPEFATNKKVKWSSSKKSVATVNQNGEVRGKKTGTAQIKVKTVDGGKEATCKVKVSKKKKRNDSKGRRTLKSSAISKRYVFSFDNSLNSFDIDYGYRLPKKLLNKLVDKVFPTSGYKSKGKLRKKLSRESKVAWGGTCYGINAVTVMNRCKNINVRKYCKAKGEGYDLRYVKNPKENRRVANLLNYYFLSQKYVNDKAIFPEIDKNVWKKLIQAAKGQKLQMCSITSAEGGGTHNILLKKWIRKKGDWHYIETYDCNYPQYKTYIRINTKQKKLKSGYTYKENKRIVKVEENQIFWCRLMQDFYFFEKMRIE